jgi:hypothetical protein
VVSRKILDRLVDATYPSGDIRVGIALLKMSVYSAMRARRVTVTIEDVEWVCCPIGERGSSHNKRIVSQVTEEEGGVHPLGTIHQNSLLNVWGDGSLLYSEYRAHREERIGSGLIGVVPGEKDGYRIEILTEYHSEVVIGLCI